MKDNNQLDLLTDFAIDISESANGLSVLIKHDYYSADNENGRELLRSFLDGLSIASDRIYLLIITDSAVRLLETSEKLISLVESVNTAFICSDSAEFYDVVIPSFDANKVHIVPRSEITEQIIESRPNLILE